MRCMKCGHILIFLDDDEICPKCQKLAVLDPNIAIKVAARLVKLSTKIFNEELEKWERDTLLGNLAARRELFSQEFFRNHTVLNVGKLTELTLLIKRVTELGSFRGKTPLQASEIDKLVNSFEALQRFESILLNVRAGLSNILCQKRLNVDSFTLQ
jgi:hypothetical protein